MKTVTKKLQESVEQTRMEQTWVQMIDYDYNLFFYWTKPNR